MLGERDDVLLVSRDCVVEFGKGGFDWLPPMAAARLKEQDGRRPAPLDPRTLRHAGPQILKCLTNLNYSLTTSILQTNIAAASTSAAKII